MSIAQALFEAPQKRHTIQLSAPGPQLRLALYVLAVALGFGLLFAANTYAAYAQLFGATLSMAPHALVDEIAAQTGNYLTVSVTLAVGLVAVVAAVSIGVVHRLLGPIVALERQVRALAARDYGSRVALRSADRSYTALAQRLNELAQSLEREAGRL